MDCVTLDLETTDLSAVGAGFILLAVAKPLRGEPVVWRYDEMHCRPGHEQKMLKAMLDYLRPFDLWIGHNIVKFDFQMLKSRAALLGVEFNLRPLIYDTMHAFRRVGYRTAINPITGHPRASLDHVVDFFGIEQKKTKVGYPRAHWKTVWSDGEERKLAMDNLMEHCIFDVEMQEKVYLKLIKVDPVWGIRRVS